MCRFKSGVAPVKFSGYNTKKKKPYKQNWRKLPGDTKWMDKESSDTCATKDVFTVDTDSPAASIVVRVETNGKPVGMEIYTGATQKFNNLFPGTKICQSKVA